MLTKVMIGDCKVLCSAVSIEELEEMYEEVADRKVLNPISPKIDEDALFFHYQYIGPHRIRYKDKWFILWGTPRELRFYTPEEYEVIKED